MARLTASATAAAIISLSRLQPSALKGAPMYVPAHYEESRPDRLHDLIVKHPLGALVTHGASGLDANHLPFDLEVRPGSLGILHTHVARANAVWRDIASGDEVLVVFRAADAYISPNWYPSKHEHHRQVPTWNYMVAHAHGRVTVQDDERYLRGLVGRLTKHHEAAQPRPRRMADSPQAFISEMLAAIVGLEIEITRLVGKFKLGQNKATPDVLGASRALKAQGDHAIADAMAERISERPDFTGP
jgi:transcriptional regulator